MVFCTRRDILGINAQNGPIGPEALFDGITDKAYETVKLSLRLNLD
jgi:hypothetical protein